MRVLRIDPPSRRYSFLYMLHSCWTWPQLNRRWELYRNTLGAMTGEWL